MAPRGNKRSARKLITEEKTATMLNIKSLLLLCPSTRREYGYSLCFSQVISWSHIICSDISKSNSSNHPPIKKKKFIPWVSLNLHRFKDGYALKCHSLLNFVLLNFLFHNYWDIISSAKISVREDIKQLHTFSCSVFSYLQICFKNIPFKYEQQLPVKLWM